MHESHSDDGDSLRGAQDSAHEEEDPHGLMAGVPGVRADWDIAQIEAERRAYGLVADQKPGHEEVEACNDNDECGANQKDSDQGVHVFPLDCSRLAGSRGAKLSEGRGAVWQNECMGLSKKLLSKDEVVVRHMHTHIKVLLWRIVAVVLLLVAAIVGSVFVPVDSRKWALPAIWIVFVIIAVPLFVVPWVKWMAATYTVTTKRIITRSGIFQRTGHDLPLSRISDIQMVKDLNDRLFGCGTLALQTSADDPLLLHDVPNVEIVQVEISNLLFNDVQGAIDADPNS